jgi:LPXTG-site transpeptidase (sortase) family protein
MPASAIASQRLYPGELLGARSWSNPLAYEPAAYVAQTLLRGFTPVHPSQAYPLGSQVAPRRLILIPDLAIDSQVIPLRILSLGDSRAYETPRDAVGHIPESANPGEQGSAWFFGHLESPLLGGGSVFYDLPKVPGLLRQGKDVYIIADSGTRQYLYQVTSTRVVHQDDLKLDSTDQATIHLVTCVPRLVYDYRLIVTGQLVGVK